MFTSTVCRIRLQYAPCAFIKYSKFIRWNRACYCISCLMKMVKRRPNISIKSFRLLLSSLAQKDYSLFRTFHKYVALKMRVNVRSLHCQSRLKYIHKSIIQCRCNHRTKRNLHRTTYAPYWNYTFCCGAVVCAEIVKNFEAIFIKYQMSLLIFDTIKLLLSIETREI